MFTPRTCQRIEVGEPLHTLTLYAERRIRDGILECAGGVARRGDEALLPTAGPGDDITSYRNEPSDPAAGARAIGRRWWIDYSSMSDDVHDRREREAAQAEDLRARAEEGREFAEEQRETKSAILDKVEAGRAEAEAGRSQAETERTQAESLRKAAEAARSGAEALRIERERIRVLQERIRGDAEAVRILAEQARQSAEEAREALAEQRSISVEMEETRRRIQSVVDSLRAAIERTHESDA